MPATLIDILNPHTENIVLLDNSATASNLPIHDLADETLREYIVILKEFENLADFYNDMETEGGLLYLPHRAVELVDRRPSSRSTHYMLTTAESVEIVADSRVESVTLTYSARDIDVKSLSQTSSHWNKSSSVLSSTDVNWGLYRCYIGEAVSNWGNDGDVDTIGTINITNSGHNVDVVICDGHINPLHPEFAVNSDGSGGSRVIQYNWFQHNMAVRGVAAGTYVYDFLSGGASNNAHGSHVAGIAAGNSQGWARGANIYNISPYGSGTVQANTIGNWTYYVLNYINQFHINKPINPLTGVKNPTIVNMSWGFIGTKDLTQVGNVGFQGATYPPQVNPWSVYRAILGLVVTDPSTGYVMFMARDSSIDGDVSDCLDSGIILVGAAGNLLMYNDAEGGLNYDNALYDKTTNVPSYYMRGGSPGAAVGVINVSSIDVTVDERKADYSNAGPRTNVFSPGSSITSVSLSGGVTDPRNAAYYLTKMSGTSMASPQVTGVLACALETYPTMSATQVAEYLLTRSSVDQLSNNIPLPAYPFLNYNSLLDGPNLYLKYTKERADIGIVTPKTNYFARPTVGIAYPRARANRYSATMP